uniref:NADH-ubiquinone oxidoreductase chain 1 n=1 Tax=Schistosoma turkestanicum TaxID=1163369 RepID=G4WCP5_9TREM|nr:NADH dehydrogenase subunit 1 [Schistosoma turkestanicum]
MINKYAHSTIVISVVVLWSLLVSLESFLVIMIMVAFYILCERKFLGYIQLRKGPNKVGFIGLLQSFADLLKSVLKNKIYWFNVNSWFSRFGCIILLFCSLVSCFFYALYSSGLGLPLSLLFFLVLSSFIGYGLMMIGWCSWNKYGLLSAVRVSFSSVMFEMVFMCIILLYGLCYQVYGGVDFSLLFLVVPVSYIVWLVVFLGEGNRPPLDYGESESELVSGFSLEYSGMSFLVIFACEYLMMFVFSWLSSIIFISSLFVVVLFHLVLYAWMRGTVVRLRYDYYVYTIWCYGVIVLLLYLVVSFGL